MLDNNLRSLVQEVISGKPQSVILIEYHLSTLTGEEYDVSLNYIQSSLSHAGKDFFVLLRTIKNIRAVFGTSIDCSSSARNEFVHKRQHVAKEKSREVLYGSLYSRRRPDEPLVESLSNLGLERFMAWREDSNLEHYAIDGEFTYSDYHGQMCDQDTVASWTEELCRDMWAALQIMGSNPAPFQVVLSKDECEKVSGGPHPTITDKNLVLPSLHLLDDRDFQCPLIHEDATGEIHCSNWLYQSRDKDFDFEEDSEYRPYHFFYYHNYNIRLRRGNAFSERTIGFGAQGFNYPRSAFLEREAQWATEQGRTPGTLLENLIRKYNRRRAPRVSQVVCVYLDALDVDKDRTITEHILETSTRDPEGNLGLVRSDKYGFLRFRNASNALFLYSIVNKIEFNNSISHQEAIELVKISTAEYSKNFAIVSQGERSEDIFSFRDTPERLEALKSESQILIDLFLLFEDKKIPVVNFLRGIARRDSLFPKTILGKFPPVSCSINSSLYARGKRIFTPLATLESGIENVDPAEEKPFELHSGPSMSWYLLMKSRFDKLVYYNQQVLDYISYKGFNKREAFGDINESYLNDNSQWKLQFNPDWETDIENRVYITTQDFIDRNGGIENFHFITVKEVFDNPRMKALLVGKKEGDILSEKEIERINIFLSKSSFKTIILDQVNGGFRVCEGLISKTLLELDNWYFDAISVEKDHPLFDDFGEKLLRNKVMPRMNYWRQRARMRMRGDRSIYSTSDIDLPDEKLCPYGVRVLLPSLESFVWNFAPDVMRLKPFAFGRAIGVPFDNNWKLPWE